MIVSLFLLGCVWLEWFWGGWKKGWKTGEKMDESSVWLGGRGRGRENWWGSAIFPLSQPKLYYPKLGRKHKGKQVIHFRTNLDKMVRNRVGETCHSPLSIPFLKIRFYFRSLVEESLTNAKWSEMNFHLIDQNFHD